MKHTNLFSFATLLLFAFIFSGCPMGIAYPPGEPGTEKIDKGLIGTWVASGEDYEVMQIKIEKASDFLYRATVIERGPMYSLETDEFYAGCTSIGNMKFVYFEPISDTETEKEYYTYIYKITDAGLETYNFSLLDGGVDAVTSTEAYRKQIETSVQMTGGISDTIRWIKK